MRILLIEDEARIADFVQRGLESSGYRVDVAGDGKSGLAKIHDLDYDLLILDLMLPDTDGLSVLEKVKNRKVSPAVLILSARAVLYDRVRGLEMVPTRYLVKPFAFVELLARVKALLRPGTDHAGADRSGRFDDGLHQTPGCAFG